MSSYSLSSHVFPHVFSKTINSRRKTAPKQYVSALEQRIKFLEALLKERDISHESHGVSNQNEIPGDDRSVHSWQYLGDREDEEENGNIPNGNDLSISRLKVREAIQIVTSYTDIIVA